MLSIRFLLFRVISRVLLVFLGTLRAPWQVPADNGCKEVNPGSKIIQHGFFWVAPHKSLTTLCC